jgi:hypothetical protein
MKNQHVVALPQERIETKIYFIRGKKVMIDRDLAELYGVETKVLNQAVRRNAGRFPDDFVFQLNKQETEIWMSQIVITNRSRSQIVTLNRGRNIKYAPYVFTEQGVAMLSSVLKSERAIMVNVQIMRTFTKIREMIVSNKELREKIEKLERNYDSKFRAIFQAIKQLMIPKSKGQLVREIGFRKGK